MKTLWRRLYLRWLARRLPATVDTVLSQRRIFILPSRFGLLFLLLALMLFIGGINYQNNLLMGFSFLLFSFFCVAILHSFRNLAGLRIQVADFAANFAGSDGEASLQLLAAARGHQALRVYWQLNSARQLSLQAGQQLSVELPMRLRTRGWNLPAARLVIDSFYPLGLLRTWTSLDMAAKCLAWPRPLAGGECPASGGNKRQGQYLSAQGNDDFAGLKRYQLGDSLHRVDWKAYARGHGLNVRYFVDPAEGGMWLDWQRLANMGLEERLSRLCFWALELESRGQPWGLLLPSGRLSLGIGDAHLHEALNRLACVPSGVADG